MNKSTGLAWYALRITYSRELAFKQYLDDRNIENFIPMRYEYVVKGERKIRKLVPVVHNLVFVYASRLQIDEIKTTAGTQLPIRYIMDRETNQPITIPETQMRSFIAVAGSHDQQVVYLDPTTITFKKGPLPQRRNVEGNQVEPVIQIPAEVVSIQGVMAIATAFIHPSLIEPVNLNMVEK